MCCDAGCVRVFAVAEAKAAEGGTTIAGLQTVYEECKQAKVDHEAAGKNRSEGDSAEDGMCAAASSQKRNGSLGEKAAAKLRGQTVAHHCPAVQHFCNFAKFDILSVRQLRCHL